MSSSISPKIFKERYFCFYSSTTQNDNKLIFAKVQKLNNIFTKKTDEELSKTHTKIHTDYNSMYISSPIEQQYTNSSNNIKNDKTDIYKEKIDDFLKENHLDYYMISYILINQYNIKMKILLSTQSKCIKEGNLLFNNKKLHKILIKLKDRSINSKSNFINTLFTEDECKYVYHFMNFYYRYVDINILYNLNTNFEGKTDEEITILKKENHLKMNYNNKIEICNNINKAFELYFNKVNNNEFNKDFDIKEDITSGISSINITKYFYIINPFNTLTNNKDSHMFIKNINLSFNKCIIKTDYNFKQNTFKDIVIYVKNLFKNYNTKLVNYTITNSKPLINLSNTTIYDVNINNYSVSTKNLFIKNNILDKKHDNGILKIKEDYDLCYLDISNNLIYISKYDYYLENNLFNELLDNKVYLSYYWFTHFFNSYFSFRFNKLGRSKFYKSDEENFTYFNKPLKIISKEVLAEIVNKISNKKINFTSNEISEDDEKYIEFFKSKNISKLIDSFEIQPFDYQKENVLWMKSIEANIISNNTNIPFICNPDYYLNKKVSPNIDFCCVPTNNISVFEKKLKLYKYDDDFLKKYTKYIKLSGGILSDEVGLGKTLSCITHILTSYIYDITDEYKDKIKYNANNLIIVPNRLVAQWYTEIKNYIKPALFKKLGVIKITTITDIKKKLYDIDYNSKYNIYIISSNLINNTNYFKYLSSNCYDIQLFEEN